jgi:Zn-dependent M16 (insulinase) family peptidase
VRLTLRPDTQLSQRKEQAEQRRLAEMKAAMTEADKLLVIKRASDLAQRQEQVDDPEILPKVGLEDVPAELSIPQSMPRKISGTDSTLYAQGTNGLVYHELAIDMPALTEAQLDLIPYYSTCLTELGCGNDDYLKMQERQSSVSGGIHSQSSILGSTSNVQAAKAFYLFTGKALIRNNDKLAELMHETMHTVRFDELDRIKELISQQRARRERSVTGNGHVLAMTAAASGLSPVAALAHRFGGLEAIRSIKRLDDGNTGNNGKHALTEFAGGLSALHQKIVASPHRYMLTAEADKLDPLVADFEKVWTAEKPADSFQAFSLAEKHQQTRQMWVANTQVNFCAKAYPTVPMEHADAAALAVLGGFLRNGYLHTSIRERGGAYGGGASHDSNIAAFKFYSYRDPRLTETLDDFDRAIEWMLNNKHEWRQLEEAILGVIGAMDKPGSPYGEARHDFHNNLHGRSREKLQAARQRVLAVTLDDLRRVTENYLQADKASTAVITSAATYEQLGDLGLEVINL